MWRDGFVLERTRTCLRWIAYLPALLLGLLLVLVGLALTLLLLLTAPILVWWRNRRRPNGPRVIDVEYDIDYTVREAPTEE